MAPDVDTAQGFDGERPSMIHIHPQRWPWFHRIFRWIVFGFSHLFYRIRVRGHEQIPASGGALLVSNHISWLDGPLLMMMTRRPLRTIVHEGNFRQKWFRRWGAYWGAIYIGDGPKAMVRALKEGREALQEGYLLLIFPEGGISRTGQLQGFRPGMTKILQGTHCPVIPVFIDELWGSIFSFSGGRFFRKWPRSWPYPISLTYGAPLASDTPVSHIDQTVAELGATAVQHRQRPYRSLLKRFIRSCKRRPRRSKVADSSDTDNTGGELLLRTLILRRLLRREKLDPHERYVGVLLPPSVGGVIANMALAVDGRVPIHLNYTMSSAGLNHCIAAAGISHVVTSRRVMSKLDVQLDAPLVYLEDLKDQLNWRDKLAGALGAYVVPARVLEWLLPLSRIRGGDTATIIFTSGSTGTPKGVVLSYDNICSNVDAIDAVVRLTSQDVVLGILPFFHSFGYTVTLWTPMALDLKAVYHFSPLDARRIGLLAQRHGATVLLSTPTFLRGLMKRCTTDQFRTLDVVVAGAEKLPKSLSDAFEERFGVRPVEGYGCTELSPLVSVNIPPSRSAEAVQIQRREGSVGRPIPNVAARTVDRETGEPLSFGESGLLQIKGPNVMQGYLNDDDKTAEVLQDGWYNTGDVAFIDEDGFIHITGRESRFSKIGGEMVPHVQIEESLAEILGIGDDTEITAVVTAVPDEKKGERLVVLHRPLTKTPQDLCEALVQRGLPNLFIPSPDCFLPVEEFPLLGTGKLDLKAVRELAERMMSERGGKGVRSLL